MNTLRNALGIAAGFIFSLLSVHAAKPNVLFIAVDDLNDWPKFMGYYPDALTPNMDRLAARGVAFTNAHCHYPMCGPSRASIFSGMTLNHLGHKRGQPKDKEVAAMARKQGSKLLHSYFKDHGYKTMAVGKLLHKHVPKKSVDMSGGRGDWNKLPSGKKLNWMSKKTLTDWGPYPGKDSDMTDYKAASWGVKRLQESHKKPFLLMVGFLRPHVPWYVPQKWFDLYPDKNKLTRPPYLPNDADDLPKISSTMINEGYPRTVGVIKDKQWQDIIQSYLACISFVDAQVGRLIDALDKSPYGKNTVIILWSDHGYHMGEKNTFQKHTLWERSSRSPMIITGPNVAPGQKCNRVVGLIDIYPTLLDMCGLPANPKCDGRSLAPLLKNPQRAWPYPVIIKCRGDQYAVQTEKYRYIRYKDGSEELYDHTKDPNEWHNLAKNPEYRKQISELKKHLPIKAE